MPTLVHLADERNTQSIKKNGIKPANKGFGVYAMPVTQHFYASHQWLRELKSDGVRTIIGVYFKLDSSEMVYVGRYNQQHRHVNLGEAIKIIMALDDPMGFEVIIDRKIAATEITKIKNLPQVIGWRHFPDSNNIKPCACEYCLRGTIKGRKTYDRLKGSD